MKGDTLFSGGDTPTAYVPLGGGRFRTASGTEVRFEGDASPPSRMIVRTRPGTVTFARADTVALDSVKLAEYASDYRSDEVDVTHSWKLEKGQLVVYAGYRRLGILEPSYTDGFTPGRERDRCGAGSEGTDHRVPGGVWAGAAPAIHAGAIARI